MSTPREKVVDILPMYTPYIDRMNVPNEFLNDVDHHYRYGSKDANRINFLKSLGYEAVTLNGQEVTVDNSVLMRCPRDMYEARNLARRIRSRQLTEAPRKKVQTTGENLGVEVTDQTREYRGSMTQALSEKASKEEQREGQLTRQDLEAAGLLKPNNEGG